MWLFVYNNNILSVVGCTESRPYETPPPIYWFVCYLFVWRFSSQPLIECLLFLPEVKVIPNLLSDKTRYFQKDFKKLFYIKVLFLSFGAKRNLKWVKTNALKLRDFSWICSYINTQNFISCFFFSGKKRVQGFWLQGVQHKWITNHCIKCVLFLLDVIKSEHW